MRSRRDVCDMVVSGLRFESVTPVRIEEKQQATENDEKAGGIETIADR